MFANKRNSTNLFIWGLAAGVFGGIYLMRWMGHMGGHKTHTDNQSTAKKDKTHQEQSTHTNEQASMNNKDKLFETFMNASEDELNEKASQMNLKN